MHSGNIENYSFIHGYHRNNLTGKWFPLHPHTLGRALTHDEMDYNLLYSQQTVAGWRIFGLNADLTLSDDEIGNSLIFHKIRTTDTDYVRYVAAGYTENMYIWITPIYDCTEFYVNGEAFTTSTQRDCSGFVITLSETSPSIDSCDIFGINNTDTTSSKPEGWISGSGSGSGSGIVPTATPNIGSGSGSGSGIVPTATPNIGSGSGSGSGMAPTPLPSPTVEPIPTEVPAPSYMSLSDNTGGEAEEGETFQFTIETKGIEGSASIGYKLGGSAVQNVEYRTSEEVNRQIIYQNKATIEIEVIKGAGRAIEIILDTEDSQGNKTNDLTHVVKIVEVSESTPVDEKPIDETPSETVPAATVVPDPTATPVPDPTATVVPDPTATPVPDPTATAIPDPTATPVPDKMYVSLGDNTGGEANLDEIFQLRISTQGVKEGVKTRFTFESASYNKHFIRVDEEGGEWESDPLSVMIDGAGNGTIFIRVIQGGVPLEITLERNDSDGNETRELTHSVKLLEIRGGEGVNPIDAEPAPVDS